VTRATTLFSEFGEKSVFLKMHYVQGYMKAMVLLFCSKRRDIQFDLYYRLHHVFSLEIVSLNTVLFDSGHCAL